MARNAEMAGTMKNQAKISARPAHWLKSPGQKAAIHMAVIIPMTNPLKEKARPGSQGSKMGVRTAPDAMAQRKATTANRP